MFGYSGGGTARVDRASMTSRLEQLCLDKGLKMTEQRRVIARVLSDSADHPDVEQVYRRATTIDPRISIATVYRTVRLFEEANILARQYRHRSGGASGAPATGGQHQKVGAARIHRLP